MDMSHTTEVMAIFGDIFAYLFYFETKFGCRGNVT